MALLSVSKSKPTSTTDTTFAAANQTQSKVPFAKTFAQVAALLLLIWIPVSMLLTNTMERDGAYASTNMTPGIDYLVLLTHAKPETAKPNVSYESWATSLMGCDPSNYVRAGLGFADGKGVYKRDRVGDKYVYTIYSGQGAGTPIFVGIMAKLFGQQSIFPYVVIISLLHYLSAVGVVWLTSRYTKDRAALLLAGALSLLSIPIIICYSGIALFSSEAASDAWYVAALIPLSAFWLNRNDTSKKTIIRAVSFALLIGIASYFRDSFLAFASGTCGILFLLALLRRDAIKQTLLFCLVAVVVVQSVQLPWKFRNYRQTGFFAMSTVYADGFALWNGLWSDYRQTSKWCPNCASGLASYLDPAASPEIVTTLNADHQKGAKIASKAFLRALWRHPIKAILYKAATYDKLWFGDRDNLPIYAFCLISTVLFLVSVTVTGFAPEVVVYPLLLLLGSVILHYEHRLSFPYLLVSTPVSIGILLHWAQMRFPFLNRNLQPGGQMVAQQRD